MINRFWFLLLTGLFIALLSSSCGELQKDKRKAVAKVYDYYLYEDELLEEIPFGLTERDSIIFATNFINNWISQKLLLHQAESNLNELRKDFTRQLEEYRQSLTIYAYERELILQKLDTIVTEEQIETFYAENRELFQLKDNIVKVVYLKLELKAPNINLVKNYVKNAAPEDLQKLEDYGPRYAANYYLDDETWLYFNDLLKEIPIKTYDQENFLRNNRFIEIKDSLYHYFVHIKNFMVKESLSPLDFEKDRIAEMIVNRRKVELLGKMQEEIYHEASTKGKIEVY
jgi:hypothetical protein